MSFRFWKRGHEEAELDEELQAHLRMAAQGHMDRGETREQAEASARRDTGNVGLIKEVTREMWGWTSLERLLQDFRFGARMLRKNPGSTLVSLLTLALGVGASTAIFSVVYGVLLRPLPYEKPEQIVRVWEVDDKGHRMQVADPNFDDLQGQNHTFQALAQFHSGIESVSGGAEPRRLRVATVSGDFFMIMGVSPVMGRPFAQEDKHLGAAPVVLVSYSYWRQSLNGVMDFSGLKLNVEGKGASIIGVLPPGFRFPDDTDIWMAREISVKLNSRSSHNWNAIGRLREGVSSQQAQAELAAIGRRLKQQYGQDIDMQDAVAVPLQTALTSDVRLALLILLGAVGFLLLVACANVMNLLLAQAAAREGELAVRSALGASRGRLVRQFLAETLLLTFNGGVLGVIIAYFGVRLLLAIAPPNTPRLAEVSVNLPVFLFALGLCIFVAAGLGVFTALHATAGDVQAALAEGGRGQGNARRSRYAGGMIISGQLAITLVLLVGAGLEGRSLLRVLSVDPGFRTERVLTIDLALSYAGGEIDKVRRVQFINTLFERLHALPGVHDVGGTDSLPLGTGIGSNGAFAEINPQQLSAKDRDLMNQPLRFFGGDPDPALLKADIAFFERLFHDPTRAGYADHAVVSEGYFRVLGVPLLRGRLFDEADTADATPVALISESLAKTKWPNQDALGRTIEFGNMDGDLRLLTIVGVVSDVRERSVEAPPRPTIYVNYRQRPQSARSLSVVMRTSADPATIFSAARRIINELDPNIPPRVTTFTEVFAASLNTRRFNLILVGIFAGTALLLAIAGIYGVLAYSVARRTREIGVRIALGASTGNVLGLVLRQAMLTAGAGVAIGIVGSFVLTRLMQSLLFEISPTDPLTFTAVALMLLFVAAVASYLPARRAAKVDPIIALRYE
jgi:putative ABC transport system permease protein